VPSPVAAKPARGRAQQLGYQPYDRGHQEQAEVDLLDNRKAHADSHGMGLEQLESLAAGFLHSGRCLGGERRRPQRLDHDHLYDTRAKDRHGRRAGPSINQFSQA